MDTTTATPARPGDEWRLEWHRFLPLAVMHLACALVLVTGTSTVAVATAIGLYALRMFAITGFYHRYFSHRTFRTSRGFQLVMALLGGTAAQRGPLWWAAHHRNHHRWSDTPKDLHSPARRGFWWSHLGWFHARGAYATRTEAVKDLMKFPELRFVNRFDALPPLLLAGGLFGAGELLRRVAPGLGTSGLQMVVWGFVVSTVVLYHATYAINSFAHRFGSRRFPTADTSRNNGWLALLTFGEGWHNNHHFNPGAARQGFYWWEIDLTYYGLRLLERLGLIWDLRPVPAKVLALGRGGRAAGSERTQ